jgi:hypothetical protein
MAIEFQLPLAWSQVSLFEANLTDPFNDWTDRHLSQGFTWRPGSVSFHLPFRQGEIDISLDLIDDVQVTNDARRAIVVPFTSWGGAIEVSTIAASEIIDLPTGRYGLLFQVGLRNGRQWVSFGLFESAIEAVEPVILRADDQMSLAGDLLMRAEPAA